MIQGSNDFLSKDMEILDCNTCIGFPYAPSLPVEAYAETGEALLERMAFCGIHRALVRHIAMEEESPVVGNRMVIQETQSVGTLTPAWAILPSQTGELGTPREFTAGMKANGVRALWAFPSRHRYLLNGTTFGELFEVMIERRIPLFISAVEQSGGVGSFAMIEALFRDFPRLTVVVTNHGCWGEDRLFRPLIERHENFYIDTSRYELAGGICDFFNRYGPHRMIFGTGFPETPMGGALLTLAHAEIPDEAKEAVFGGNLKRLVEEVAKQYPEVIILMGHSGYGEWDRAIGVARDYPNVFLELTAAYHANGIIEKMVKGAGSHKMLFGTDLSWFDPHYGIGRMRPFCPHN